VTTLSELDLLYAEDNPMDADQVRARLAEVAPLARLEVVDSGRSCLERLVEHRFDLLLLDNRLLDIDGIDVLSELSRRRIDVPVVMMTGTGDEDLVVQALRLGALDYVPKTANWLAELPRVLERARARYAAHRAAGRLGRKARRIAYVGQTAADGDLIAEEIADRARHLSIVPIGSAEEAVRIFSGTHDFDLLLIDLRLAGRSALEVIREIEQRGELPPTIVISGQGDDAAAIAALRLGAFDYISKREGYLEKLPHTIDHAVDWHEIERSHARLERELVERRRTEEALRVSESRFRRLWDAGFLGILLTTTDGRVVEANDVFLRMIGSEAEDLRSGTLHWDDLAAPALRGDSGHTLRALLESGIARVWETEFLRRDGGRVPVLVGAAGLEGGGLLAYALDQTEREVLRSQLDETQRLEAIGRLAGGVAHDINNLLTVALLNLETVSAGKANAQTFSMIRESLSGASSITRELLAFGRHQHMKVVAVDLGDVVHDLFAGVLRSLGEHIEVELRVPSDPFVVEGDRTALERVIVNLVANARDAMARGGKLRVTIDREAPPADDLSDVSAARASWVHLSVEDTGEGIAPDLIAHVFEPFVTGRSSGQGTGLGLASVYGIVTQHAGVVRIDSEQSVGTRVDVFLRATEADAAPRWAPSLESGDGHVLTLLLVEDDPRVRTATSLALRQAGHVVIEADDGPSALRIGRDASHPIDVIVTDNTLPGGMFGVDVVERLRVSTPKLGAVLMSGIVVVGGDRDVFLPKPFTSAELASAIAEARRRAQ